MRHCLFWKPRVEWCRDRARDTCSRMTRSSPPPNDEDDDYLYPKSPPNLTRDSDEGEELDENLYPSSPPNLTKCENNCESSDKTGSFEKRQNNMAFDVTDKLTRLKSQDSFKQTKPLKVNVRSGSIDEPSKNKVFRTMFRKLYHHL